MIATSLRIVPWRCESLWHFCMLDTDMIVDRYEPFVSTPVIITTDSKSAHFSAFCGFAKLKVLNLRLFYSSQNQHLHFPTVLHRKR